MFCTSLRKRPAFTPILPALISDARLKLRESMLTTHDLEIPLEGDNTTGSFKRARTIRSFRILLLAHPDVVEDRDLQRTIERVQHFASLTGGRDVAMMFLMSSAPSKSDSISHNTARSTNNAGDQAGIYAFSKLQAAMMDLDGSFNINVLPVSTLDQLPNLLHKYTTTLSHGRAKAKASIPTTSFDLLQLCTANPPMSRQTAYVLSDVYPDLRSLAEACTFASSELNSSSQMESSAVSSQCPADQEDLAGRTGPEIERASKRRLVRDLIGEEECNHIVDFWKEEWTIN